MRERSGHRWLLCCWGSSSHRDNASCFVPIHKNIKYFFTIYDDNHCSKHHHDNMKYVYAWWKTSTKQTLKLFNNISNAFQINVRLYSSYKMYRITTDICLRISKLECISLIRSFVINIWIYIHKQKEIIYNFCTFATTCKPNIKTCIDRKCNAHY